MVNGTPRPRFARARFFCRAGAGGRLRRPGTRAARAESGCVSGFAPDSGNGLACLRAIVYNIPVRIRFAALSGELAVPCTCNPLQQGRMPGLRRSCVGSDPGKER